MSGVDDSVPGRANLPVAPAAIAIVPNAMFKMPDFTRVVAML